MVQEARLDLILLGAMVVLAAPASAQEGPLTTLMRPPPPNGSAPLGRTDPLSRQDRLFGEDALTSVDSLVGGGSLSNERPARRRDAAETANSGKPGEETVACDPQAARRRPRPGLASGGSGPGEYGRFVDNGRGADAKPSAAPPRKPAATPGDVPLYGGNDRPLWGDPAPRTAASGGTTASEAREPAPTPGADRPLWADAGTTRATTGADACDAEPATRRAGVANPPTQTLFFKTGPAR